jgi:protein phosphatase 1E
MVSKLSAPRAKPFEHPDSIPADELRATVVQMFSEYMRAAFGASTVLTLDLSLMIRRFTMEALAKLRNSDDSSEFEVITDVVEEIAESCGPAMRSPKNAAPTNAFATFNSSSSSKNLLAKSAAEAAPPPTDCTDVYVDYNAPNCPISTFCLAIASAWGSRNVQEDTWQCLPYYNALFGIESSPVQQRVFGGIYDGHSGAQASVFARTHMHAELAYALSALQFPSTASQGDIDEATIRAIQTAYSETDRKFCRFAASKNIEAGTTALTLLLQGSQLYVSHVGDTMAVLVLDGVAEAIGVPHKPNRPDEQERIKAAGGCVVWFGAWRVDGVLAVSRSIGDAKLKHLVPAVPETNIVDLSSQRIVDSKAVYVIAASDGLWDVFDPQQAAHEVKDIMSRTGAKLADIAADLAQAAIKRGSKDNITITIWFLK